MIEIRNVRESDLSAIAQLEEMCFSLPWNEDMLRTQLTDDHIFLAAADEDKVLGYVGVRCIFGECFMNNIAVHPDARRQHIGDALLTQLRRHAEAFLAESISLEVRASNSPAISLYAKHGYIEEGRRKNYYSKPREDAVIMTVRWQINE